MSLDRFTVITRDFMLGVMMVLVCISASANTIAELLEADKVRVRAWLEPEENIIARQQIYLQIEVATDKWFSSGTRIGRFEIKDAIVMQREKFAVNSTRTDGDKSWTVQQWTLVVYPQRDGLFEIPAIPLQLSVAGDGIESIIGEANTQPMSFETMIPEQIISGQMQDKKSWIASNRFDVEESFNRSTEELVPGDALVRTLTFSADNLPAMMLPEVEVESLEGIAVYRKPPQLTDKVNRGDYIAERTEVITYVFEKPGEYLLPRQVYHWWNLETRSLESIELEEHALKISGMGNGADPAQQTSTLTDRNRLVELMPLFKVAGVVLLAVIAAWFAMCKFVNGSGTVSSAKHEQLSEVALRKQFENACANNDYEKAIGIFYRWLDNFAGDSFKGSVREQLKEFEQVDLVTGFKDIMRAIYAPEKSSSIDLKLFASQYIDALEKKARQSRVGLLSVDLKLN
ncbi:MAG: BatD family protein [Proteobacteria bacterium]|nr:BatD family protein [Pseudomonadota bacterium]